jgi:hypothetical protein
MVFKEEVLQFLDGTLSGLTRGQLYEAIATGELGLRISHYLT